MPIDLAHSIQMILAAIVGAFFGNLLSLALDKRFFGKQQSVQHENVYEVTLVSIKIGLYIGVAALTFVCIDLLLASVSINIRFVEHESFFDEFFLCLFVTNIGTLEQAFKVFSTSKNGN